jgi:transcriptional regulator GlxA family with amidase domain
MMSATSTPTHVSLLVLPESTGAPIHGMYETLVLVDAAAGEDIARPQRFAVELVGPERGVYPSATGLPLEVQRSIDEVDSTDIVIMGSMLFDQEWVTGRYPRVVEWLREMHGQGADLASACAGALLLAETGLLEDIQTTTHWAFAETFRRNFPDVELNIDELLIVGGPRGEFVMAGGASSWQDLVLYLIARHAGPREAQAIGKFLLYEWSARLQSPFVPFSPRSDHGDAVIQAVQAWLEPAASRATSVEDLAQRSGLPASTFKRRFKQATGYSPLHYLQRLRIEEAKRLLEQSEAPVEEICWTVGYDEPASFRRLFKRVTSLTPSEYRRKFRAPQATVSSRAR